MNSLIQIYKYFEIENAWFIATDFCQIRYTRKGIRISMEPYLYDSH